MSIESETETGWIVLANGRLELPIPARGHRLL